MFTFYYLQTYSTTHQTPDSAATATAFLTGQKTTQGTLGVGQGTPRGNCAESKKHPLKSILKHSQDKSKHPICTENIHKSRAFTQIYTEYLQLKRTFIKHKTPHISKRKHARSKQENPCTQIYTETCTKQEYPHTSIQKHAQNTTIYTSLYRNIHKTRLSTHLYTETCTKHDYPHTSIQKHAQKKSNLLK